MFVFICHKYFFESLLSNYKFHVILLFSKQNKRTTYVFIVVQDHHIYNNFIYDVRMIISCCSQYFHVKNWAVNHCIETLQTLAQEQVKKTSLYGIILIYKNFFNKNT
jgi:hypothetical protein